MLYLQRLSDESFVDEAREYLINLNDKGQLPDLSKGEHGHFLSDWLLSEVQKEGGLEAYPVTRSFSFFKSHDSFVYHYTVVLASKDGDWKLQKAWRTDASEHVVEEYPVP